MINVQAVQAKCFARVYILLKTNEYIHEILTLEHVYGKINKVRNQSGAFGGFISLLRSETLGTDF